MRGKKSTPELIYAVMCAWAITGNVNDTAKKIGIAESTARKIVNEHKNEEEFAKLCEQNRQDFAKKAERIRDKALDKIEKDLNSKKDVPMNHLTALTGMLTDKLSLIEGKPTESVRVDIKLPEGIEEYAG